MIDIAFVLLVVAVLLAVIALCQPLAAYLKLPPPVLLGVVGAALGGLPLALSTAGRLGRTDILGDAFASLPISSAIFINVFLPPLVFEAGIATDVRLVVEDAAPILLLAIVATLVTTAAIGLALWPISGVPLVICLLLGAVVATADLAAVIAIFRDVGAPGRLTRLVEGEALLNDAAAIGAIWRGTMGWGRRSPNRSWHPIRPGLPRPPSPTRSGCSHLRSAPIGSRRLRRFRPCCTTPLRSSTARVAQAGSDITGPRRALSGKGP